MQLAWLQAGHGLCLGFARHKQLAGGEVQFDSGSWARPVPKVVPPRARQSLGSSAGTKLEARVPGRAGRDLDSGNLPPKPVVFGSTGKSEPQVAFGVDVDERALSRGRQLHEAAGPGVPRRGGRLRLALQFEIAVVAEFRAELAVQIREIGEFGRKRCVRPVRLNRVEQGATVEGDLVEIERGAFGFRLASRSPGDPLYFPAFPGR